MNFSDFAKISPTTFSDFLKKDRVMNISIKPLWEQITRIAGPAYTVKCPPGDNLMLHAAIYKAPPGSIIVIESADLDYAVAGGNVCAVAQKNGIAGFIVDGVIRDLAEIRENRFPVFARGIIPIPGGKEIITSLNSPIQCGGVQVNPGDVVVADEEGIVVIPLAQADDFLKKAKAKLAKEETETLSAWEANHRAKIEKILQEKGFKQRLE